MKKKTAHETFIMKCDTSNAKHFSTTTCMQLCICVNSHHKSAGVARLVKSKGANALGDFIAPVMSSSEISP